MNKLPTSGKVCYQAYLQTVLHNPREEKLGVTTALIRFLKVGNFTAYICD